MSSYYRLRDVGSLLVQEALIPLKRKKKRLILVRGGMKMNRKMLSMLAGAALLSGMGAAYADEPMRLTEAQMDQVAAGEINLDAALNALFLELSNINFENITPEEAVFLSAGIENLLAAQAASNAPQ